MEERQQRCIHCLRLKVEGREKKEEYMEKRWREGKTNFLLHPNFHSKINVRIYIIRIYVLKDNFKKKKFRIIQEFLSVKPCMYSLSLIKWDWLFISF